MTTLNEFLSVLSRSLLLKRKSLCINSTDKYMSMLQLYIQVKVKNTDFPNREGIRGQIPEILAYPNCLVIVGPGVVAARVDNSNNDIVIISFAE